MDTFLGTNAFAHVGYIDTLGQFVTVDHGDGERLHVFHAKFNCTPVTLEKDGNAYFAALVHTCRNGLTETH